MSAYRGRVSEASLFPPSFQLPAACSLSAVLRELRTAWEEIDALLTYWEQVLEWVGCRCPDHDKKKQHVECFGHSALARWGWREGAGGWITSSELLARKDVAGCWQSPSSRS